MFSVDTERRTLNEREKIDAFTDSIERGFI